MRKRRVSLLLKMVLGGAVWLAGTLALAQGDSPPGLTNSSPALGGRPQHFRFALDGAVREVKSWCGSDWCSSFVLIAPVSTDLEDASSVASGMSGKAILATGTLKTDNPEQEVEPTLELWRLQFPSDTESGLEPKMRRLGFGIPDDAGRIAVCQSKARGGAAEREPYLVMFQAQGSVFFVDPDGQESRLGSGTRVGSEKFSAPARPWARDCSEILLVGPGEARMISLAGRGTRRSVLSSKTFPIPLSIRRNSAGLTLESPEVHQVNGDETDLIVVGPRVYDSLRLETIVFPPTDAAASWLGELRDDPSSQSEASVGGGVAAMGSASDPAGPRRMWSRLPGAETVLSSRYLMVDGALVMVVVTKEADKIGLLERKKLRLFRLATDRTRLGNLPFFETLTASRLWQRLDVKFIDVSGDGVKDLVLVQPEGLGGEPTVADVFLASGPLQFAKKKTRTVLETGLVWWSLENDWDGDGLADVVVLDEDVLQFHKGQSQAARSGRRHKKEGGFWSSAPSYSLRLQGLSAGTRRARKQPAEENDANDQAVASGNGSDQESVEEVQENILPSYLRKVWVDDGVLVIPTGTDSAQLVFTEEGEMITISGPEAAVESEESKVESMIHVVRKAHP